MNAMLQHMSSLYNVQNQLNILPKLFPFLYGESFQSLSSSLLKWVVHHSL